MMNRSWWSLAVVLGAVLTGRSAEPTVTSNDLPRIAAVEAKNAPATFQLKKGFRIELAASEPNVASPVALSFDENGRMYVVEMIDYSERREELPHLGRIRLLEDTNEDGIFDRSKIFARELPWPTAVICYGGGVLVGATPDILFLKDTDGDGQADSREVMFTGFAEGVKRINVQAMLNSFRWGLDNRIHGVTSGNGAVVKALKHPQAKRLDLHGRDFVIEPRAWTMISEAGGGQHGMSFDEFGRRFTCSNSDHIRLFMYDEAYAIRNSAYAMPAALVSIAADGPAAEVYRISPEEPWRVIRTRWRVAGLVSGPIEGGGRSAGYFTGATGTTIYRGNAFPPEYRNNAFVGDAGGNLVHRKVMVAEGLDVKAQRPSGEEKVEFLASTDTWFRPVQFANAPDGALYIIDMYREVIEHPWSLPANIKQFLDLNSGNDRGRIYRIVPDGFKQPKLPRLGRATTAELVGTLEHANGWHRDTAARLLYERQDQAAGPLLARLLIQSKSPLGRLHALHALEGLGLLQENVIMDGLKDADAHVREHAVKLAEKLFRDGQAPPRVFARLIQLANDPAIEVRYQLAFTLGEIKGPSKIEPLAAIIRRDLDSSWMRAALLSSLAEDASQLFGFVITNDPELPAKPAGQEFLSQLVMFIGGQNRPGEIEKVTLFLEQFKQPALTFKVVRALGEGLQKAGSTLMRAGVKTEPVFAKAQALAGDQTADERSRVAAIELLGVTTFKESGELLLSRLNLKEPQAIQLASIASLSRFADSQVGAGLVQRWDALTPRLRSEALAALLARTERASSLLEAMAAGAIRPSVLDTTQQKFLRQHKDKGLRELAARVLDAQPASTRQQAIEALMPALDLKGDASAGKKIYQERCLSCHRAGGEGHALGPDLVTVKNTGKEKLLVNIVDPNREVRPEFVSYLVETKGEDSLMGLVANETAVSVTLKQAFSKQDVILRSNITRMQSQGQSLMPEGLEAGLKAQDMADLLEYIATATQ